MYSTSRYPSPETRKYAITIANRNGERYHVRGKLTIFSLVKFAKMVGEEKLHVVFNSNFTRTILIDSFGQWAWEKK